nr:neutral ceramidase 2-like [Tanacetum cinerariifolium]
MLMSRSERALLQWALLLLLEPLMEPVHLTSHREMISLLEPDEKQIKGRDPKPILIDSGEMHEPYDWA